jgi:hypothetical protein
MMIADLVDMEDLQDALKESNIDLDIMFQEDSLRIEEYLASHPDQKASLLALMTELDQKAPLVLPEARGYIDQWKPLLDPTTSK